LTDSDAPVPGFEPPSRKPETYPSYPAAPYPGHPGYPAMSGIGGAPAVSRPGAVRFAFWLLMLGSAIVVAMFVSALVAGADELDRNARETLAEDGLYTESDVRSFKTFMITAFSVMVAVGVALFVVFGFVMRTGRNWARVTLTVLLGIGLLVALGLALGPVFLAVRLLAVLMFPLNIAIIVAMFQGSNSPFFDPRARMGMWRTT
jgi:hypothetical protein